MTEGLSRRAATKWIKESTGVKVGETRLRYWEEQGLIERPPCASRRMDYGVHSLVTLRIIIELRAGGAPLQRINKAMVSLKKLYPDLEGRPGSWNLLVTGAGNVARYDGESLIELTEAAGQSGWFYLLHAGRFVEEARAAIRESA